MKRIENGVENLKKNFLYETEHIVIIFNRASLKLRFSIKKKLEIKFTELYPKKYDKEFLKNSVYFELLW